MTILTLATIALIYTAIVDAALCLPSGLLGLGAATDTLNGTFILKARASNGTSLPIINSASPLPGGFFLPLYLGTPDTPLDSFTTPLFTLQGGTAYGPGGTVLSTMQTPLLGAEPLYISADSTQAMEMFQAVNATCDGEERMLLRFQGIVPVPLATASVNETGFVPGAGISSPILENLISEFLPSCLLRIRLGLGRWKVFG